MYDVTLYVTQKLLSYIFLLPVTAIEYIWKQVTVTNYFFGVTLTALIPLSPPELHIPVFWCALGVMPISNGHSRSI